MCLQSPWEKIPPSQFAYPFLLKALYLHDIGLFYLETVFVAHEQICKFIQHWRGTAEKDNS